MVESWSFQDHISCCHFGSEVLQSRSLLLQLRILTSVDKLCSSKHCFVMLCSMLAKQHSCVRSIKKRSTGFQYFIATLFLLERSSQVPPRLQEVPYGPQLSRIDVSWRSNNRHDLRVLGGSRIFRCKKHPAIWSMMDFLESHSFLSAFLVVLYFRAFERMVRSEPVSFFSSTLSQFAFKKLRTRTTRAQSATSIAQPSVRKSTMRKTKRVLHRSNKSLFKALHTPMLRRDNRWKDRNCKKNSVLALTNCNLQHNEKSPLEPPKSV